MTPEYKLTQLQEGESALITQLQSVGTIRRRLQDLGMIEGTRISCVQKSPFGDPVAYVVRGAVIALRSEDAHNILVARKA